VPLGKVVGLKVLYKFGLYKFFLPPAVTMGCYNVHAKTYFNQILENFKRREAVLEHLNRTYYMKYDGKLFLLNDRIDKNTFYSWVTLLDTEEEAQKYEVSLTYYECDSLTVS